MELTTIREVSQAFGISTRTLRYYEEVGLLDSHRTGDGAFRAYSDAALLRLKQILVLRALRLPLKHIRSLLLDADFEHSLSLMIRHTKTIEREVETLTYIMAAMQKLVASLMDSGHLIAPADVLDAETARTLMRSLTVSFPAMKEVPTMPKLTDVRIVYLPPATVASYHCMGPSAEAEGGPKMDAFIKETSLAAVKPDFRHYGFNHPDGQQPDMSDHGYEFWVTIPEDLPVHAPYVKKQFPGGLYAAHMIPMGAFDEWQLLHSWVLESDAYEMRMGDPECMHGLLEETLNCIHHVGQTQEAKDKSIQLDLLFPIQEKASARQDG